MATETLFCFDYKLGQAGKQSAGLIGSQQVEIDLLTATVFTKIGELLTTFSKKGAQNLQTEFLGHDIIKILIQKEVLFLAGIRLNQT